MALSVHDAFADRPPARPRRAPARRALGDQRHAAGRRDAGAADHLHDLRAAAHRRRAAAAAEDRGRRDAGPERAADRLDPRRRDDLPEPDRGRRSPRSSPALRDMAGAGMARPIYVRADGRAPYAIVAQVMAALSASGFTNDQPDHRHRRPVLGRQVGDDATPPRAPRRERRSPWPAAAPEPAPAFVAARRCCTSCVLGAGRCSCPSRAAEPIGSSVPINIVSSRARHRHAAGRAGAADPGRPQAAAAGPRGQAAAARAGPGPRAGVHRDQARSRSKAARPVAQPSSPRPRPQPSRPPSRSTSTACSRSSPAPSTTPAPQASSAQRGPARAETAPQARPTPARASRRATSLGLQQLLERLWNPNCDVAGGDVGEAQGAASWSASTATCWVARTPAASRHSSDPVVAAAARRALDAVHEAAPYAEPYYGQTITVNFDAKKACARR